MHSQRPLKGYIISNNMNKHTKCYGKHVHYKEIIRLLTWTSLAVDCLNIWTLKYMLYWCSSTLFTMLVSHVLAPFAGAELICVIIWLVAMNTYILLSWSCLLAWAVQEIALLHVRSPSLDDWLVRPLCHSHDTWLYLKQHQDRCTVIEIFATINFIHRKCRYICNHCKLNDNYLVLHTMTHCITPANYQ